MSLFLCQNKSLGYDSDFSVSNLLPPQTILNTAAQLLFLNNLILQVT